MQHLSRLLLKEVGEGRTYPLGVVKALEEEAKRCVEYKTHSVVFELVAQLGSLYEQHKHQEALFLAESLLLNLLPKRGQGGVEQLALFYH